METFNQDLNDENIIKKCAPKNKNSFFNKQYSSKENNDIKDLNEEIVLKLGKEWKTVKI